MSRKKRGPPRNFVQYYDRLWGKNTVKIICWIIALLLHNRDGMSQKDIKKLLTICPKSKRESERLAKYASNSKGELPPGIVKKGSNPFSRIFTDLKKYGVVKKRNVRGRIPRWTIAREGWYEELADFLICERIPERLMRFRRDKIIFDRNIIYYGVDKREVLHRQHSMERVISPFYDPNKGENWPNPLDGFKNQREFEEYNFKHMENKKRKYLQGKSEKQLIEAYIKLYREHWFELNSHPTKLSFNQAFDQIYCNFKDELSYKGKEALKYITDPKERNLAKFHIEHGSGYTLSPPIMVVCGAGNWGITLCPEEIENELIKYGLPGLNKAFYDLTHLGIYLRTDKGENQMTWD